MIKIPLIKPYITDEVKQKVCDVLDSGYLTEGSVTHELEGAFKNYIGCKYAIAVTSCTTGLELALRALGVGPGDEVIVPDYTYPATASVVNIVGANVVLVDINPQTMLMDLDAAEKAITLKTKVIIPVSLFGNPLCFDRLAEIKKKHNLFILEDAACAIGAEYQGVKVGNLADISVFSLHPRKFITTGEGGIITTNNDHWASWMNSYKHFGMGESEDRTTATFVRVGTNYKLSNLQSAIGVIQMRHIDELLLKRRQLAENYTRLLKNCPGVSIPKITEGGLHSYQSFCVFIENRNEVIRRMRGQDIETQIGTYSLHMHKAFSDNPNVRISGQVVKSRQAFDYCLTLPLFHEMPEEEQQFVAHQLSVNCRL